MASETMVPDSIALENQFRALLDSGRMSPTHAMELLKNGDLKDRVPALYADLMAGCFRFNPNVGPVDYSDGYSVDGVIADVKRLAISRGAAIAGTWIPVVDRLPEGDGQFAIVTVIDEWESRSCWPAVFFSNSNLMGWLKVGTAGIKPFDQGTNVIAWMVFPEPYAQ